MLWSPQSNIVSVKYQVISTGGMGEYGSTNSHVYILIKNKNHQQIKTHWDVYVTYWYVAIQYATFMSLTGMWQFNMQHLCHLLVCGNSICNIYVTYWYVAIQYATFMSLTGMWQFNMHHLSPIQVHSLDWLDSVVR